jgi:acyl-coenzyme A thioesterase PaaI-like protein
MKPINISIEFLRAGLPRPVFAKARCCAPGGAANVRVEARQTTAPRRSPVAG